MTEATDRGLLQSVGKVLDVLESFNPDVRELGVTELALRLGVAKSTAYRLLASLEQRGYLRQDPQTSKYRLSLKLWELGCMAVGHVELRTEVRPILEQLMAVAEETVHLGILDGYDVVFIDRVDSRQAVRAYLPIGSRAPAYTVSAGKVLLAHQSDPGVVEEIIAKGLAPLTTSTITDPAELRRHLEEIREAGYATNRGEWRIDVCGLAAPVWDHSDRVAVAIGLSMPASRFTDEKVLTLKDELLRAASAASAVLGARRRGAIPAEAPSPGR